MKFKGKYLKYWKKKSLAFIKTGFSFLALFQSDVGILSKYISCILFQEGIPMVWCYDNKNLQLCLYICKYSIFTQFKVLNDLWAREFVLFKQNYEISYNFISIKYNYRLLVKQILENKVIGTTVSNLFSSAGWLEREVWDMLGIIFYGHKDLRRILTDYGFLGHPLKKDFPLTGFVELRYDDTLSRIVFEPLELSQEMRSFDFLNPWASFLTYDTNSKFFSDYTNFKVMGSTYNRGSLYRSIVGKESGHSDQVTFLSGWNIDISRKLYEERQRPFHIFRGESLNDNSVLRNYRLNSIYYYFVS